MKLGKTNFLVTLDMSLSTQLVQARKQHDCPLRALRMLKLYIHSDIIVKWLYKIFHTRLQYENLHEWAIFI